MAISGYQKSEVITQNVSEYDSPFLSIQASRTQDTISRVSGIGSLSLLTKAAYCGGEATLVWTILILAGMTRVLSASYSLILLASGQGGGGRRNGGDSDQIDVFISNYVSFLLAGRRRWADAV